LGCIWDITRFMKHRFLCGPAGTGLVRSQSNQSETSDRNIIYIIIHPSYYRELASIRRDLVSFCCVDLLPSPLSSSDLDVRQRRTTLSVAPKHARSRCVSHRVPLRASHQLSVVPFLRYTELGVRGLEGSHPQLFLAMVGHGAKCAWHDCDKTSDRRTFGRSRTVEDNIAELCPDLLRPGHSGILCDQHWHALRREVKRKKSINLIAAAEPIPLPSSPSSPPLPLPPPLFPAFNVTAPPVPLSPSSTVLPLPPSGYATMIRINNAREGAVDGDVGANIVCACNET
jgi:hypothetical protein